MACPFEPPCEVCSRVLWGFARREQVVGDSGEFQRGAGRISHERSSQFISQSVGPLVGAEPWQSRDGEPVVLVEPDREYVGNPSRCGKRGGPSCRDRCDELECALAK